jgi:hypothetical protein
MLVFPGFPAVQIYFEPEWVILSRFLLVKGVKRATHYGTGLHPDAVIISGRLKVMIAGKETGDDTPTFNVYSLTPATPGIIAAADYANVGGTKFSDDIEYDDIAVSGYGGGPFDPALYVVFELNASGIAYLNPIPTYGNLSLRVANFDATGVEPSPPEGASIHPWASNDSDRQTILELDYESPPTVVTRSAINVGTFGATIRGRLAIDGGLECTRRFEYGETVAYGRTTPWLPVTENWPDSSEGNFQEVLTGLKFNTTYHYRAIAQNSMDVDYGDDMTFTTGEPTDYALVLELAFGQSIFTESPDWTDVSGDLLRLNTKRGRMHELDRIEAGTASFVLNNSHGNWWRNNTGGDYSPDVKPLTLIRLQGYWDGTYYPLWYGVVESVPHRWLDVGGFSPYVEIAAVDIFKTFSRYSLRVRSLLSDAATTQKDVVVEGASTFYASQEVKIGDTAHSEYNTVDSISGDTLTMQNNLVNTYHVSAGAYVNKFVAQLSGDRIRAVLDDLGWPINLRDFTLGVGQVMVIEHIPPTGGTNALEHIQKVAEAENGILFQAGNGKIVYQDSLARQSYPYDEVQAVFTDDDTDSKYVEPELVDDDTFIYNGASISGTGFAEITILDLDAIYYQGERILTKKDSLIYSQADAFDQALQIVLRFADSFLRCNWLNIKPAASPDDLYPKAFGFELSTRIELILNSERNPAMLDQEYHIEGIEHNWSIIDDPRNLWMTKWQLWKVNQYRICSVIPHTGYLIRRTGLDDTYDDAHDATTSDPAPYTDQDPLSVGQASVMISMNWLWSIARGYIEINTSSILVEDTVLSAQLAFNIYGVDGFIGEGNEWDLTLVPATGVHVPLVEGDYLALRGNTTDYGHVTVSPPSIINGWLVVPLTPAGVAAIVKGGITKFGIRSSKDISKTSPGQAYEEWLEDISIPSNAGIKVTGTLTPRLFVEVA